MKAVAIIPARGGSKGIIHKNITPLLGKPMLVWTIEAARGCAAIERTIVTSDDPEILAVAKEYGAIALERPAEFSTDTSKPELVLQHALQSLKESFEYAAYLQPTSPLRTGKHLTEAFELLTEKNAHAVISVSEINRTILKSFVPDEEGFLRGILSSEASFSNRQSLPPVYMPNGAIYIVETKSFLAQQTFLPDRTIPYIMPADISVDIDTMDDVRAVETILAAQQ